MVLEFTYCRGESPIGYRASAALTSCYDGDDLHYHYQTSVHASLLRQG